MKTPLDSFPGRLAAGLLAALLVSLAPAVAGSGRVVAIGDVHGDLEDLRESLRLAGLTDADDRWIGQDATLVQTGDLLDRGTRVRQVLDLMIALEGQAAAAGGRVIALLGNHETNNLARYLDRESTPAEDLVEMFAGFANGKSRKRGRRAYGQWERWSRRFPACSRLTKPQWEAAHPAGYFAYMEALGPGGDYGRWLRARPAVVRVGETVFLHGGIGPGLAELGLRSVEQINDAVREEIEELDRMLAELAGQDLILPFSTLSEIYCAVDQTVSAAAGSAADSERLEQIRDHLAQTSSWLIFDPEGPLWFRGYSSWSDEEGRALIADLASSFGFERVVVGHTPSPDGIRMRFDGRVFLIDSGMVFADGEPSALEIAGGRVTRIDDSGRTVLVPGPAPEASVPSAEPGPAAEAYPDAAADRDRRPSPGVTWLGPDGARLPFETQDEILEFLRKARKESQEPIPTGVTRPKKLLLEKDGVRAHAVFRYVHIEEQGTRLRDGRRVMHFLDSYKNEVAAFELGRLLGMDNIPPAVERRIDSVSGSVQLWLEDAMQETERVERRIGPPDPLLWSRQTHDMNVFDNLINNIDRTQQNILIDRQFKMWWIDHTRSFGREAKLPAPKLVSRCSRRLWDRLTSLDDEEIKDRLRPHLGIYELKALLKRREKLVALIQGQIEKRGEDQVLYADGEPHVAASGP